MSEDSDDELRRLAFEFRAAIVRSRVEEARPHLPHFPDGACRIVGRLLAMHLSDRGFKNVKIRDGHIPPHEHFVRHAWLVVDGVVVDLTADPFGEAPVVVGPPTPFHESLRSIQESDASDVLAARTPEVAARDRRFLEQIQALLPSRSGS